MAKKTSSNQKDKNTSTRSMILNKSLELINRIGVVDFRIDNLASTLSLSPGNITYHFSKKEDICIVLWEEFLDKLDTYDIIFSKMMDLKQAFLILRGICRLVYDYRGVVMFRGSDVRTIVDDETEHRSFHKHAGPILDKVSLLLTDNGYIREQMGKDKEYNKNIQALTIRWWINKAAIERDSIDGEILLKEVNKSALLLLFSFYPSLTEKGLKEFNEISQLVNNQSIDL